MYKILIVILISIFSIFSVGGQENKQSIYYEFSDSITSVLQDYLKTKYPEVVPYCEIDFRQEGDSKFIQLIFSDNTSGFHSNLATNRFLKISETVIPVYFSFDGDLYQNPAEYEIQQQGEYPRRSNLIIIYDKDYFLIDLESGKITHRDTINNIIP